MERKSVLFSVGHVNKMDRWSSLNIYLFSAQWFHSKEQINMWHSRKDMHWAGTSYSKPDQEVYVFNSSMFSFQSM